MQVSETEPGPARAWRDTRVLITGGAGLIGSHIADQVVQRGAAEVIVLDNFTRGLRDNLNWAVANGPVRIVEGDIRDRELLLRLMVGIDVLFHQAAIRVTQCAQEPRLALEVMADGTFNILEAAVAAEVRKVVGASSASIYGGAEEFPTTERHHPYNNRTLYGAAKSFNEGLLRSFHDMYGLDYIALRYFNVYGPRMDTEGVYTEVLVRWMERLAAGKPLLIFGSTDQSMDMIYVEDVARANLLAAECSATDEVLNIASGRETTLLELAQALQNTMQSSTEIGFGPERKVNAVPRRLADTSRAREVLGFEAAVDLHEGLERLVAWWRNRREAGRAPVV